MSILVFIWGLCLTVDLILHPCLINAIKTILFYNSVVVNNLNVPFLTK